MKKKSKPDRFDRALQALDASRTLHKDPSSQKPKDRLDTANARLRELEYQREMEKWQTREQAIANAQETAEMIQGDIYGTLPLALAGKLSGRAFTPAEVRVIVRAEVDAMVRGWIKGGGVPAESVPNA